MSQAVVLRTGKTTSGAILAPTMAIVDQLLSPTNPEWAESLDALAYLTRLVKEGVPINDEETIKFLIKHGLLQRDGTLRKDIKDVIDALFEGSWTEAALVDPLGRSYRP